VWHTYAACWQGGFFGKDGRVQIFGPIEAAQMLKAAPKDRAPEFVVAFVAVAQTNLVVESVGFTGLAPK
jgi:hypothetical protein